MSRIKLLILQPIDPLGNKIGGTKTFIKNFIEHAPDEFNIEWVGISTNKKERPVGKWQKIKLGDKIFSFLPILYIKDENKKTKLPLILYFVLSLSRNKSRIFLDDKILEYYRIEPALLFKNVPNKKMLYILGNIKDLYNPHSEIMWSKFPWAYFKIEKYLMPQMEKVFVVSNSGLEFYKKKYPFMADRLCFMPTFVDNKKFYPWSSNREKMDRSSDLKNRYGFSKNDKIILSVGRLEGAKNPFLLIDSFYNLVKYNLNVKLLIVGTGSLEKDVIKRVKKYNLQENVKFLGVISSDDVMKLMKISDVFLMTSAFEGMPMSALEALASGLPVVSTDVGEIKMAVKDGISGLLVPDNSAESIARAVLEILNNKEKFNTKNCVDSIKDYTVEHVLSGIYKMHYDMII
ncbi:D-inositol-3-phosphate glycosyltransferase [subsurface metagenome]|nr:glycosyltransferase [Clostridia bacterium]